MNLDWKLTTIVVAVVASFTVLAIVHLIPETVIVTVVSSFVTYVLGVYTDRKKAPESSGAGGPKIGPGLGVLAFAGLLALLPGCGLLKSSVIPSDVEKNFACVVDQIDRGVTSVDQIEAACVPGQVQTVIDIIDELLGSREFAKAHADKVPALHRDLARAKSELAKKASE